MKIVIAMLLVLLAAPCWAATYYVCDTGTACGTGWATGNDSNSGLLKSAPKKTISGGIGKLASGDTLVIGDGVYTGASNMIDAYSLKPPSGTPTAYTTIMAEHDGGAVIDGSGVRQPVLIRGNDTVDGLAGSGAAQSYIALRGIIARNSNLQAVEVYYANHIKLLNIGAYDAGDGNTIVINVGRSSYVLVEGCYAWGNGRYKFSTFHADSVILRNCVARFDRANTPSPDPMGSYSIYSSTNVEVQNCIDIDGDSPQFWLNAQEYIGSFAVPTTSAVTFPAPRTVNFNNVIALNNATRFAESTFDAYNPDVHFNNCVGWNSLTRLNNNFVHGRGNIDLDHCTFGNVDNAAGAVSGAYFNGWVGSSNYNSLTNSLLVNFVHGGLFYDWEKNANNLVYGNTGTVTVNGIAATNLLTADPLGNGLRYLPRVEAGSTLLSSGIAGTYVGANIVKQYGKSGTFFGEPGYNLLQDGTNGQNDVNLWPWRNEGLIKAQMSKYSYTGPTTGGTVATLSGDRGFASSTAKQLDGKRAVTLTSYIWEKLGSRIPPIFYKPDPVTLQQAPATCSDGIQNQGETGIDCGGPCAACR
jgi:hypothetical protein